MLRYVFWAVKANSDPLSLSKGACIVVLNCTARFKFCWKGYLNLALCSVYSTCALCRFEFRWDLQVSKSVKMGFESVYPLYAPKNPKPLVITEYAGFSEIWHLNHKDSESWFIDISLKEMHLLSSQGKPEAAFDDILTENPWLETNAYTASIPLTQGVTGLGRGTLHTL